MVFVGTCLHLNGISSGVTLLRRPSAPPTSFLLPFLSFAVLFWSHSAPPFHRHWFHRSPVSTISLSFAVSRYYHHQRKAITNRLPLQPVAEGGREERGQLPL
ncbi:Uncharacterized protein Rs2_51621 [Raphanus sativus]|nr:Uncharacterized protein Rs2_51621 [Raphanus sativus]